MNYAQTLGERAKVAAPAIANASPKLKNEALAAIAAALLQQTDRILQANAEDLAAAVLNNMTESLQVRILSVHNHHINAVFRCNLGSVQLVAIPPVPNVLPAPPAICKMESSMADTSGTTSAS